MKDRQSRPPSGLLTKEAFEGLIEVSNRTHGRIPAHVEHRLLQLKYIKQRLTGLEITPRGKLALERRLS